MKKFILVFIPATLLGNVTNSWHIFFAKRLHCMPYNYIHICMGFKQPTILRVFAPLALGRDTAEPEFGSDLLKKNSNDL